jgi:ribosomal protein L11 methyltransferase
VIRLAVRARAEAAEQVLAALLEVAPSGLEQVDGEGFVEFALYGAPGELPALGAGRVKVGGVEASVRGDEVADDWAERWRRFHRPVLVAERLYVRPPWEAPIEREDVDDVVIDPGQAFGTGAHPTTEACLALLAGLGDGAATVARGPGSVVDLGCGSGVLAIAAARLGYAPVIAVDSDPAALAASEANARANGVALARLERVDLREQEPPSADVVLANLMRPLLLQLAPRLLDRPPRAAIVSGLLDEEADEVAAAFVRGLPVRDRVSRRGWTALLLERG